MGPREGAAAAFRPAQSFCSASWAISCAAGVFSEAVLDLLRNNKEGSARSWALWKELEDSERQQAYKELYFDIQNLSRSHADWKNLEQMTNVMLELRIRLREEVGPSAVPRPSVAALEQALVAIRDRRPDLPSVSRRTQGEARQHGVGDWSC